MLGNPASKMPAVKCEDQWSLRHARVNSDVCLNGMGRCVPDKLDFTSSVSCHSVLKG